MGVLLAMRRTGDPEIARFLQDPDPRLVLEAARAIHDAPIPAATAPLASVPVAASAALPLLRRILIARFQLGRSEDAAGLAAIAERSELPESARALALELLSTWAAPQGRDPLWGSGGQFPRGRRSRQSQPSRPGFPHCSRRMPPGCKRRRSKRLPSSRSRRPAPARGAGARGRPS